VPAATGCKCVRRQRRNEKGCVVACLSGGKAEAVVHHDSAELAYLHDTRFTHTLVVQALGPGNGDGVGCRLFLVLFSTNATAFLILLPKGNPEH